MSATPRRWYFLDFVRAAFNDNHFRLLLQTAKWCDQQHEHQRICRAQSRHDKIENAALAVLAPGIGEIVEATDSGVRVVWESRAMVANTRFFYSVVELHPVAGVEQMREQSLFLFFL